MVAALPRLLLGLAVGLGGPGAPLRPAGAGIAEIAKDLGAYELTDEMLKKSAEQEAADQKKMDEYKDPTTLLKKRGMDITEGMADRMKDREDLVQEAMDETVAAATELDMYQQVPCDICKSLAKVLADDLKSSWKPSWSEEKTLSHVQGFCESGSLAASEFQVVAEKKVEGKKNTAYFVEKDMKGVKIFTTKHSENVFRRVCREEVDENDQGLAELAKVALENDGEKKKIMEMSIEKLLCKKKCRKERERNAKAGKTKKKDEM